MIAGQNATGLEKYQAAEMVSFEDGDAFKIGFNAGSMARLKIAVLSESSHELYSHTLVNAAVFADVQISVDPLR